MEEKHPNQKSRLARLIVAIVKETGNEEYAHEALMDAADILGKNLVKPHS